jgi:hypothetical protein
MSTLLIIPGIVVIIVAIFLIWALFAKKDFTVTRQIVINKPRPEVFNYLRLLRNHKHFSKWATKDPAKKTKFHGTDGTVGFIAGWNNYAEKAGEGELEILEIVEGDEITLEHRYFKPVKGKANTSVSTKTLGDGATQVQWVYMGISSYPLNGLTAMMNMDQIVGKDLENCLINLRSALEKPEPALSPERQN